jgi:glycosyltransferase involved in cell wall biosynthesis
MPDKETPFVSVVLPVRNERRYIARCLDSVLSQDYPPQKMEILVVDGMSEDGTREIIRQYQAKQKAIRLIDNIKKNVPIALNLGIKQAKGEYIIRMDAHANYPQDYVSKCIEYAIKTGAENVGGVWKTVGEGYVGEAIALALSSKFGVGNAKFRTEEYEGYVDTVPFGCFKRTVFDRIGMFNEKLARNQDVEFNSRIRRSGGKIFSAPQIRSYYYCRNNLGDLWKQNYANGYWNIKTIRENPHSLSLRHFIPLIFLVSILIAWIIWPLWLMIIAAYLLVNIYFSLKISLERGSRYIFILPVVFACLHLSYGIGSLFGILSLSWLKK